MNKIFHHRWIAGLPLIFGILFVLLMIFLAVISTEKNRNYYQGKKTREIFQNLGPITPTPLKIDFPRLDPNQPPPPTSTPTPAPTPAPEKSWSKKIGDYEPRLLIIGLPVFLFGLRFAGLGLGLLELKNKARGYKNPLILTNFNFMVACIAISFSLLLFYFWALRMGLIG